MTPGPFSSVASHIRALASRIGPGGRGLSDAELLDRFVASQDQAAFEVLVWRHGGMVLGVCRRLLRQESDADDAFQAAFLVLVRKAASITQKESLAGWLYRVAYRAALAVRKRSARHEPLTDIILDSIPAALPTEDWGELRQILDSEVDRLPGKLREAFVLCCLEGKTTDEVAAELGHPRGTIGSWVSRARERLRDRLGRRGVALPGVALAAALARTSEAAPLSSILVRETAHAAALFGAGKTIPAGLLAPHIPSIAQGVLNTMFVTKLKFAATIVAVVAAFGITGGVLARQTVVTNVGSAIAIVEAAGPVATPSDDAKPAVKIDKVPEGAYGLSGSVVGKLVSKDPEKGSLVLEIRQVKNVWKPSKAKKPKSVEGKIVQIDGVFGKFIDVLVTLKDGDGVQIEVKHVKGDNLNFLGEELKKVDLPTSSKGKDRDDD